MALTIYGSVPLWVHEAGTAEAGFYGFCAGRWADDRGRFWPSLPTIAAAVGRSVRTVSRWIANLKRIGAISVARRRRPDGTLGAAVYTLTWENPRSPAHNSRSQPLAISGRAGTIPTDPPSNSVLRTGAHARNSIADSDGAHMAPVADQLVFDLEIDGSVSACHTSIDSANAHAKEGRGTATSRIMAWWISERITPPAPKQRLAMGSAIKQCLAKPDDCPDEETVRRAISDLMRSGLDTPMHLRRYFGIYPKRRPRVTYTADNPLWMHHPRRSTLRPQRTTPSDPAADPSVTAPSTPAWPQPSTPSSAPGATEPVDVDWGEAPPRPVPPRTSYRPDEPREPKSIGSVLSGLAARFGLSPA